MGTVYENKKIVHLSPPPKIITACQNLLPHVNAWKFIAVVVHPQTYTFLLNTDVLGWWNK